MPDMWMDVDAALSEVPVNSLPLLDATDFKTIEADVNYNATGLSLIWHFVTTAGAYSQTAVTPTDTGGSYDWVEQGNGLFTIEIPATDPGSGTIWNDTEGFGWFTGFATGVLPFRGPTIGFRAAALNNALIDGGDTLDVNVTAMAAGTVTAAAIANAAIDAATFAANAITSTVIANDAITAAKLNTGALTADAFAADAIVAATLATGALTADAFAADAIVAATLATGALTADAFAANALIAATFAADCITAAKVAAGTIDAATFAADVDAEVRSYLGMASADLDTQLDAIVLDTGTTLEARFTGMTSLTEWLGAMAGDQAADATALAEIKATGAGSGTYDEATDSQEAIAGAGGGGAPTVDQIADAVWDEAATGHTDAGKAGQQLWTDIDAVLADTDELQTNQGAWATATSVTVSDKTGFSLASTGLDAIVAAADGMVQIAKAVWDRTLTGLTHNIATSAGKRLRSIAETTLLAEGTAQAGANGTITLEAGSNASNDFYNHTIIVINGGTGIGQARGIDGYVGGTLVATIHPDWVTNPDATSTYSIFAFSEVHVHHIETDAITADALNADAVAEIQSGLATETKQDTAQTDLDTITGTDGVTLATAQGNYAPNTVVPDAAGVAPTAAEINAEIVDALNVDTYAEPGQGAPAATASLAAKIGYLYKNWRNRKTQTSDTWSLYADDTTTVDQKATVADDATTGSKTEIVTGP